MGKLDRLLKRDERALFDLRALYQSHGYRRYKMNKFEEYDLYVRNKDFLVSDGVITFTDTNGRLMALKPDVTLSIIKNSRETPGIMQKVYYNESVYRVSGSTRNFKEIMQTGLECIGDIDLFSMYEVVMLAMESLKTISEDFILDISHLGIIAALMDDMSLCDADRAEMLRCIAGRNADGVRRLCGDRDSRAALALIDAYGAPERALNILRPLCAGGAAAEALKQLEALVDLLASDGRDDRVQLDFSIVNDMNYYNGIVFRGYINGIPSGVLSGGQYDKLMRRMGRRSGAIGFALYLDLLERLRDEALPYDVDTVLLYDEGADVQALIQAFHVLNTQEAGVLVQRNIPESLRYRRLMKFIDGRIEIIECLD